MGEADFKPGDHVELTDTPAIRGIVARVHTNPHKAGNDIVVVKLKDAKGKADLFVLAQKLNLASRLR